jgi:hypothetical protein
LFASLADRSKERGEVVNIGKYRDTLEVTPVDPSETIADVCERDVEIAQSDVVLVYA